MSKRQYQRFINPWGVGALIIAAIILLPIISILWLAITQNESVWAQLSNKALPRYLSNTIMLCFWVGLISSLVGTGAAWLISMYRFAGSRWLDWLLLTPLAIPAYVGAYALVDFFEYAGPIQTHLRSIFGWNNAQDYWFPEIRSRLGAIIVLSSALYPYVFLLVRASFREQSGDSYEVARALGAGPFARFWRIGLPLTRPAIAVGAAIVMMETVSDFGVVDYFAVQTLTTGIFTIWLEGHNAGAAAQIAVVILLIAFLLTSVEKFGRSKSRFYRMSRQNRPIEPRQLSGWLSITTAIMCFIPFAVGFLLPVGVLLNHAIAKPQFWFSDGLGQALLNTVTVGSSASVVTVMLALFLVYSVRLSGFAFPRRMLPVTTIGYAAPGAVLGLGILIPLAATDNYVADFIFDITGRDPGLILTGTAFAIVYAFCVRFFAIAQGACDSAFERVSPNLPMAARSLGRSARGALAEVYFPHIKASVGTALLLVFVDSVKELPATLLLRPFNYDTLATRVYDQASLEQLGQAAPPATMVIAVGLVAVLVLARAQK